MLEHDDTQPPAALDDAALTHRLVTLRGRERSVLVAFLHHLAELDARRLYLAQGFPSLHAYCRDFLKLSEGDAFRRYKTARLMTRFPLIANLLLEGRLTMARVVALKDLLSQENHKDLLERATLGTERDVEVLAASLRPKPDVADSVRRLPVRAAAPAPAVVTPAPSAAPVAASAPEPSTSPAALPLECAPAIGTTSASLFDSPPPAPPQPLRPARMEVEATSARSFAVRMCVGPEFLAEYEEVKAALGHKVRDGNFETILRECFRITLESVARRRVGATRKCGTSAKPQPAQRVDAEPHAADSVQTAATRKRGKSTEAPSPQSAEAHGRATGSAATATSSGPAEPSRYVPAAVRREVWRRDGGRCAFVSDAGRRCGSAHQVEVHHIAPFARGGQPTVENLSLRCRQHNLYEAEVVYGADFMGSLPFRRCEDSARPWLPSARPAEAPRLTGALRPTSSLEVRRHAIDS